MSVTKNIARIREHVGSHPVRLIAVTKNARPKQIEEEKEYKQISKVQPEKYIDEEDNLNATEDLSNNKKKKPTGRRHIVDNEPMLPSQKEFAEKEP